jgi:anti-sigma factor RsiW
MKINRINYENFFLLYIDNELSVPERKAVELFVEENEDLKSELQALQLTIIKPNALIFENKNSLLKDEFAALQQNLLLYVDDELSAAEKLTIEKQLQEEIDHLTKIKITSRYRNCISQ